MVDYKTLGSRIRAVRLEKKMTQEQLAEAVGVGVTHISHIETGNSIPSLQVMLDYSELFAQYPDVLTATDISKVIGYGTTSINDWCRKGHLKAFKRNNMNHIPKVYLIEFCCSKYFRTITRKSEWHIRALQEFPRWQVIRGLNTKE